MGERFGGRPVNTLQNGFGSFDLMIDTLVAGLASGPWILGARFTAPDVLLGSGIHFMDVFKILPNRPELRAYAERCRARPGFRRAVALESA